MATTTIMSDQDYKQAYATQMAEPIKRAHWISSPDEHESHHGETLATRSHEVIQHWAEARDALPATVTGTEHEGRPGVLRFDFPLGASGGRLRQIEWDEWFETFDSRELVMLFQEHLGSGQTSNFFRLLSPHREDG